MRVLITGANGFIGKNLVAHLRERSDVSIATFVRGDGPAVLADRVAEADCIFHLAGVNRPQHDDEFEHGNADLTRMLAQAVRAGARRIPIVYTSSSQADLDNAYGASKRAAEQALRALQTELDNPVYLFRLPNVFGKWCRPNYNSAVATFCHNIVNGLPIQINNPDAPLRLVYVDDVVATFIGVMDQPPPPAPLHQVEPVYTLTVGELAAQLRAFHASRSTLITEAVGTGLTRALYATYISYFAPEQFTYPLVKHEDPRGVFVEMLKTRDAGQFSYFTAHPGITRGGHYHHSKTEKFLVIKGRARFGFRHIDTGATYELCTSGDTPEVVETIPGWSHDITNIGEDEMIVMLWANEIFDRQRPDTFNYQVKP